MNNEYILIIYGNNALKAIKEYQLDRSQKYTVLVKESILSKRICLFTTASKSVLFLKLKLCGLRIDFKHCIRTSLYDSVRKNLFLTAIDLVQEEE